jgi:hypothetical protein
LPHSFPEDFLADLSESGLPELSQAGGMRHAAKKNERRGFRGLDDRPSPYDLAPE